MSETEFRTGKVREVSRREKTLTKKVEALAKRENKSIEDLFPNYDEADGGYLDSTEYVYANGQLFKILEDSNIEEDGGLCEAESDDDGVITYRLRYYNGGTCFSEMLEAAVKKLT